MADRPVTFLAVARLVGRMRRRHRDLLAQAQRSNNGGEVVRLRALADGYALALADVEAWHGVETDGRSTR